MTEKSPFTSSKAGEAFLIDPGKDQQGPGILVLHSWWGLNDWTKTFCKRLSTLGYTVLAPDMMAGAKPTTAEEGQNTLGQLDPDELSGLVMSSAQTLRAASKDSQAPIGVIGLSMGASLAYWLSARLPESVSTVVGLYGTQAIDFEASNATYLGLYGANDEMVSEDDRVATESFIRLGGNETKFVVFEDAEHWFFEEGENFNEIAAEEAWQEIKNFLSENLG